MPKLIPSSAKVGLCPPTVKFRRPSQLITASWSSQEGRTLFFRSSEWRFTTLTIHNISSRLYTKKKVAEVNKLAFHHGMRVTIILTLWTYTLVILNIKRYGVIRTTVVQQLPRRSHHPKVSCPSSTSYGNYLMLRKSQMIGFARALFSAQESSTKHCAFFNLWHEVHRNIL